MRRGRSQHAPHEMSDAEVHEKHSIRLDGSAASCQSSSRGDRLTMKTFTLLHETKLVSDAALALGAMPAGSFHACQV